MDEDLCIHEQPPARCSICNGRDAMAGKRGGSRGGGFAESLDTPASVEKYRSRYPGERESTFEAYVDVFFSTTGARCFPGGWTNFSRCANAEPALARDTPELVRRAEELMRAAGYVPDDSGRPRQGRRWNKAH